MPKPFRRTAPGRVSSLMSTVALVVPIVGATAIVGPAAAMSEVSEVQTGQHTAPWVPPEPPAVPDGPTFSASPRYDATITTPPRFQRSRPSRSQVAPLPAEDLAEAPSWSVSDALTPEPSHSLTPPVEPPNATAAPVPTQTPTPKPTPLASFEGVQLFASADTRVAGSTRRAGGRCRSRRTTVTGCCPPVVGVRPGPRRSTSHSR